MGWRKGNTVMVNGIKCYESHDLHVRWLLRLVKFTQWSLWKIGIPWHDPFFDECTPDFNCCMNRKNLKPEDKEMLRDLVNKK